MLPKITSTLYGYTATTYIRFYEFNETWCIGVVLNRERTWAEEAVKVGEKLY